MGSSLVVGVVLAAGAVGVGSRLVRDGGCPPLPYKTVTGHSSVRGVDVDPLVVDEVIEQLESAGFDVGQQDPPENGHVLLHVTNPDATDDVMDARCEVWKIIHDKPVDVYVNDPGGLADLIG